MTQSPITESKNWEKEFDKVIGPDIPRAENYNIMNPFRRMDEENREKLNAFKHKQRSALKEMDKEEKV